MNTKNYMGKLESLHFIEEGSKQAEIDDKLKYINSIFDLYYYITQTIFQIR